MDARQQPLRVLVDTNVILDLMLRREPWLTQAQPLLDARDARLVRGYIPASALTDIFCISRRLIGVDQAFAVVDGCLGDFEILAVNRRMLEHARRLPGKDFEDNVQIACAVAANLDLIITRDPQGFTDSPIDAIEPQRISQYLDGK